MDNIYKLDLHVHSILSHDGGISEGQVEKALSSGTLDFIAFTDHNEIDFALKMKNKYGNKIIVGEEILTKNGEIIGLFLKEKIKKGLTLEETISLIKKQNGLCLIPHPYSIRRHGIGEKRLFEIYKSIDLIEGYNARAIVGISNKSTMAFAKRTGIAYSVGSDAHSFKGLGQTYNLISDFPTRANLVGQLKNAEFVVKRAKIREYFAPRFNKIKKIIKKK